MHLFRKHQRALLIFIFLVVGVPMLFFGLPSFMGGPGFGQDIEVATVEGVPIMASEFRRGLSAAAQQQARGGESPTYRELQEQGIASDVFEQMMVSALITSLEEAQNFDLDQDFLEEELKDDPTFKDDEGNFNGARFNQWVRANPRADWQAIYDSVEEQVRRQTFMAARLASANRVLDEDVQQELEDNATKIQMEYVKVEPEVDMTDEEIQAHYDENEERYQNPPTYAAEYVAFSLKPEGPGEKVTAALERARAGEDFAALADEVSDLKTQTGGDLGWLAERETELDYRKPLFALGVGDVSDPVPGPNGYYIYKVDEERTNEETEKREIKARHIYIEVKLSEEDRAAIEEKATLLAEQAKSENSLAVAATAMEKTVATATDFNVESTEIAGIPNVDAFQFRRAIDELAQAEPEAAEGADTDDAPSDTEESLEFKVVTGRDNIYVARLTGQEPGAIPPLAEVRTEVTDDLRAQKKGEEAYKEKTAELAEKIVAEAATLDEVKAKFPELNIQIKETRPFTKAEYLFQEQIYLQTPQIYDALEDKEPNELAGPLTDFLGATYLIALTKRTEATEEEKANWDEEGKEIRDRLLATARFELSSDYAEDLKQRNLANARMTLNDEVYEAILGLDDETGEEPAELSMDDLFEETPAGEAPAEDATTADDAATEEPAPADESTEESTDASS